MAMNRWSLSYLRPLPAAPAEAHEHEMSPRIDVRYRQPGARHPAAGHHRQQVGLRRRQHPDALRLKLEGEPVSCLLSIPCYYDVSNSGS